MKIKELLDGILGEYFTGYKYDKAVNMIKDRLSHDSVFKHNWENVSNAIKNQNLSFDDAFNSVAYSANLPLDEDTGNEAYKWLNLLIKNIENDGEIIEY